MNDARRRAHWMKPLSLACALFVLFTGTGCEDLGPVGRNVGDNNTEVVVDTLEIGSTETDSILSYTGLLTHISAGRFNDPLFGDVRAIAYIKPQLPPITADDRINIDTQFKVRFIANNKAFYGDTSAQINFDLIRVGEIWRAKSWKLNDEPQLISPNTPVGTFSITLQDTVEVTLNRTYLSNFSQYFDPEDGVNRDSLYRSDFHGIAIVPSNDAKIVPFIAEQTEFFFYRPDTEEDSVKMRPLQWAYGFHRTNTPDSPAGSDKVTSTLDNLLKFDLDITRETLGSVNISKVDLVFYQNSEELQQSLQAFGSTGKRPDALTARLYLVNPENNPDAIDLGNPIASGQYDEEDEAFHFNITSFANGSLVEGVDEDFKFFVTVGNKNGIVYSSMLYNDQAPADKTPKLIVTSIKTEGISN